MPVILAAQEAEIRKIKVQDQPRKIERPCLKNSQHKKGLAEWCKSACLASVKP
jgi:hypothetical protein